MVWMTFEFILVLISFKITYKSVALQDFTSPHHIKIAKQIVEYAKDVQIFFVQNYLLRINFISQTSLNCTIIF